MSPALKLRLPAIYCAIALLFCAFVSYPVADIGMGDDWSYIESARVLAQTGHVVYNGWAAAMLGWQLLLGAVFAKLFGPSFTAIRSSTLLVALATAFLSHRTLVRAGISSRSACVGTLCLVLSPLFVPLALSFMTDVGGLFCILLCFYACLRALQAATNRAAMGWLIFAGLSNTIGGTIRQIAWLGVLAMVPSAIWLLKRRPFIVPVGAALYAACTAFIFWSRIWFARQPYSVPQSLIPGDFGLNSIFGAFALMLISFFSVATFLLPVLVAFVPFISKRKLRAGFLIFGGIACAAIAFSVWHGPSPIFESFLAPFPGNYVSARGMLDGTSIKGMRPSVLPAWVRIVLTLTIIGALHCLWAFLSTDRPAATSRQKPTDVSSKSLMILLFPFSIAYFVLLLPTGLTVGFFDRYLLPFLFFGILFLLRLFEERTRAQLPALSVILTVVFAFYAVAGTHDAFSMFRAEAAAFAELRAAGIPATAIDGGFEQNSMTQIRQFGYMNDPRIRVPSMVFVEVAANFPKGCEPQLALLTPAVVPGYALSFDPNACMGLSHFAPVIYHNWLGPHSVNVYIVNTAQDAPRKQ